MEGLLRLQNIEYIEITPEGNAPLSAGEKRSKNIVSITVPMVQTYQNRRYPIATLYIQAGLDGVYDRLLDKFLFILLGNAIIICTGSGNFVFSETVAGVGVKAILMKPLEPGNCQKS